MSGSATVEQDRSAGMQSPTATSPKPLVYRLRKLPDYADRQEAGHLLSKGLGDTPMAHIKVFSIAQTVSPWERPQTRTATVMIDGPLPALLQKPSKLYEWKVHVDGLPNPLILDTHFHGFTPLNDVSPSQHTVDFIAISGLASHAFGSWQQRGDKTFMWLRDRLPKAIPFGRVILYGYDTKLVQSDSFQSIPDLSLGFIAQLRANGWTTSFAKPIVFVAHSLGGLIIKQALVTTANNFDPSMSHMLSRLKGGLFFGVPNLGMDQSYLRAMVDGQPNEVLVEDLAPHSEYLKGLESQFSGISYLRGMRLHWAYETRQSVTVTRLSNGAFSRSGPPSVLVNSDSATRGILESDMEFVFPVNEDHSGMVKLGEDDPITVIVLDRLSDICVHRDVEPLPTEEVEQSPSDNIEETTKWKGFSNETTLIRGFRTQDILDSLEIPGLHSRQESIEDRFHHTFEWIYSDDTIGFSEWLQKDYGLFWIHGKPGSGKSTMMKFILEDSRTKELLHDWQSDALEICVGFFFNFRGTAIQKSFEGLLRSVLYQILEAHPQLTVLIKSVLPPAPARADFGGGKLSESEYQNLLQERLKNVWSLASLEKTLRLLLVQQNVDLNISLFFDALDEYDGQPNFISRFLMSLVDTSSSSRTKIKVCFSSRPWEVFKAHFKTYPGFAIDDHTKEDIEVFCADSISDPSQRVLLEIREEVVSRSRGVFLWVKLVMQDLLNAAASGQDLLQLTHLLDSLPDELDEYYAEIVRRISPAFRWDAYAMLEIAIRTPKPIDFEEIVPAVIISTCSTFQEALLKTSLPELRTPEYVSRFLGHCGGLLDLAPGASHVQLLHQTVYEFVTSAKFKDLILEKRSKTTFDNGFTFLTKWLLVRGRGRGLRERFPSGQKTTVADAGFLGDNDTDTSMVTRYARLSEETTGRHLGTFLRSVPTNRFVELDDYGTGAESAVEFAALHGLRLFIKDSVATDPGLFRRCDQALLSLCIQSWPSKIEEEHCERAKFLLEHGFEVAKEPLVFGRVMRWIFHELRRDNVHIERLRLMSRFSILLLEHGQNAMVDVHTVAGTCKAIHAASLDVTRWLLDHGTDPNIRDERSRTPLEYCLDVHCFHFDSVAIERDRYETACLLAQRGGIWGSSTRSAVPSRINSWLSWGWEARNLARLFEERPESESAELTSSTFESERGQTEPSDFDIPRDAQQHPQTRKKRRLWTSLSIKSMFQKQ